MFEGMSVAGVGQGTIELGFKIAPGKNGTNVLERVNPVLISENPLISWFSPGRRNSLITQGFPAFSPPCVRAHQPLA